MNTFHIISLLCTLILFGFNNITNSEIKPFEKNPIKKVQKIAVISDEVALDRLKNNCYACHNPNSKSHDDILAPPLAGIKQKYKKQYPKEKVFIEKMSDYIAMPTEENALMKGPVKRFGVMPKTALSKTEIQELVKYIYNNEIEAPVWFQEHFEEKHGKK